MSDQLDLFGDDVEVGAVVAAPDLDALRAEAAGCTRCPLYEHATQTVFGEGPTTAEVMLVGEQPGDQEDKHGHPFVGPAGRLLDKALAEAGIDRTSTYVTNAVKHFKFTSRGKARIHATPGKREVAACKPWLEGEVAALRPRLVVALGATAAKALLGDGHKVSVQRGEVHTLAMAGHTCTATSTVHPSSILRAEDDQREAAYQAFVADLRGVAEVALRLGDT